MRRFGAALLSVTLACTACMAATWPAGLATAQAPESSEATVAPSASAPSNPPPRQSKVKRRLTRDQAIRLLSSLAATMGMGLLLVMIVYWTARFIRKRMGDESEKVMKEAVRAELQRMGALDAVGGNPGDETGGDGNRD